jgi:DNA-binding transcriptional LysR family regulator
MTKLSSLNLNLMVALDALLAERSISRAASRVGIGQSGMSKSLRRLRAHFGDELLVRVGGTYSLTPFARAIAAPLHETLSTLEETMDRRPRFDPQQDRRLFRIAASGSMEYLVLKPLIDRLLDAAPRVSFDVRLFAGPRSWKMVELGELDLCLCTLNPYWGDLSQRELYPDRVVCAVWSGNPEVGEALSLDQLATLPQAAYNWPGRDPDGREFPEWLIPHELPVRIADEHYVTRLLLLRDTRLVMFTSEKLGMSLSAIADIRTVNPPFEPESIRQGMLWHPHDTDEPAHRWLRDQLIGIGQRV